MGAKPSLALAGLLLLAAGAPARAARPLTPPAPEFPKGLAWLGSEELSLRQLHRRRVTLVAFINTASLNSIRTLPVLNAWWQRYSLAGLMIIGVHAPDFDFDRDPASVKGALKRYNVGFPVVLDNDLAVWKSYDNDGWPAFYLVNHKGRIVYDRAGEGGYKALELEIREALANFNGYWAPDSLKPVENPAAADCGAATATSYLGTRRGRAANLNGKKDPGREIYSSREGELGYRGPWDLEPEDIRLSRDNPGMNAFARVIYRGAQAYAILGRGAANPARVYVKQDDLWLHAGNGGADIQWDSQDKSFVLAAETRPYHLTKNEKDDPHELQLIPSDAGAGLYDFEFSDFCQAGRPMKE